MSIADYANRKYDFLALRDVKPTGDSQLGFALFSAEAAGQIAVGVQKLTQRWLLEFLTERGSMPALPARGTDFMADVRSGRLRSSVDVQAAFSFASFTARTNLSREEDDTWPDDERIGVALLSSVAFLPGYANIRVVILSRAGTARDIILPISTLPQSIG